MFNPPIHDRIIHKLGTKTQKLFVPIRQRKLDNTDFTIISNNCWGGVVYEYYGLPKQSPTIGAYFYAEDYIKFLKSFEYYIYKDLEIIPVNNSKYAEWIKEKNVPVGRLDKDVEIVFLHYKDAIVAKEKWERRKLRINKENLIFKFSFMNNCTEKLLDNFCTMKLPGKKIAFVRTPEEAKKYDCAVYYPGFENNLQIENDTFYWKKSLNVTEFLNGNPLKR